MYWLYCIQIKDNIKKKLKETIINQNTTKMHLTGLENLEMPQFNLKITEMPHEKLPNTAILQTL